MPFTIEGNWVPSKPQEIKSNKPVNVRLVKRGKSILTVILNLSFSPKEMDDLGGLIKKKLGCGGGVKDGDIEIQGSHVEQIKKILAEKGIKSS